ncbi:hypothetical protein [Winogradskyella sp. SYSU M77433]|uniref:OB-fold protein n=1 Tax=Winogradskyella sp. SYSU M77433 TaxID=3042722 RepID=UPI0024800411|nr:hypothetical protein [Winogradskyella sp. SYSU M77433]MDH7912301.1 hypothetical protein [Winogradskyella sp. SYSU M77433]
MLKKIIIIGVVVVVAIVIGYNYIYQDHRDIETETAEFILSSNEITNHFSSDPTTAEQKFLNKTIEVSGVVSDLGINEITIDDNIFCQFTELNQDAISTNSQVTVKGRVIGYDDLLEQVKLDQCTILK